MTDQHQENVYQVVNMCYRQWQTIFTDPDLDRVTRNKTIMYFTEAMKFLAFRL